ncbi:hypothetical protein CAPN008_07620 [Capnocytophaga canis]|nr:hypothetical protein CAPN008_07620 [Capnocytophaga canis]
MAYILLFIYATPEPLGKSTIVWMFSMEIFMFLGVNVQFIKKRNKLKTIRIILIINVKQINLRLLGSIPRFSLQEVMLSEITNKNSYR